MEKQKKVRYISRILVAGTRNIDPVHRHLMMDLMGILPHSKKCDKIVMEQAHIKIPQLCQDKYCSAFILFQTLNGQLIMHIGKYPKGPTISLSVLNIHSLKNLNLAGNFSKQGRCLLTFDSRFGQSPKYQLVKELLIAAFNIPDNKLKHEQFLDRMMSFYTEGEYENRIWFRQFEITQQKELMEIGPRFVLELLQIRDGCLQGTSLYQGITIKQEDVVIKKVKKQEKKMQKLLKSLNDEMEQVKEELGIEDEDE